ncbi:MAG TPA: hypothetical protein VIW02_04910 [Gammaproteobacteria bacterium]
MIEQVWLQYGALFLVVGGVALLVWVLYSLFRRRGASAAQEEIDLLSQFGGDDLLERYALLYLQVDALIYEGAQRNGHSTRKIGGLYFEPVEVDSWSLALELFRKEKITFKTYTQFLFCRRIWIRVLAGNHDAVTEEYVDRCERLVNQLNEKLKVPPRVIHQRVTERLEAAGVML